MFTLVLTSSTSWELLAAVPSLLTVYVVCTVVGGGMLVISTFLGGDADADSGLDLDVDVDVDLDVDVDVDLDVDAHVGHDHGGVFDATSLAKWFSMQFMVYFAAMFGFIGLILTTMTSLTNGVVLAWSVAGGVLVGQCVHQLFRYLKRTSSDSAPTSADYVKKLARVTMTIQHKRRGEIALDVRGRERFIPCTAQRADDRFEVGQTVAVVAYRNGAAEVVSREEYEFVTNAQQGGNDDEHDSRTA
jgi:hypothetical protein